jgi:hypothetical protein
MTAGLMVLFAIFFFVFLIFFFFRYQSLVAHISLSRAEVP